VALLGNGLLGPNLAETCTCASAGPGWPRSTRPGPAGRGRPPDLRDWLAADYLAWFVLDVVDQLDLKPFLRAYRADRHGPSAYHPKTLP
jgi:hypothetical protein